MFFNLPARRKFLKADTAETAQVSSVTQLALGYHEVGFVLKSGARILIGPARFAEGAFTRFTGTVRMLVPVSKSGGDHHYRFHGRTGEQGPRRAGPQHVFVNNRVVRDRTISRDSGRLRGGDDQGRSRKHLFTALRRIA